MTTETGATQRGRRLPRVFCRAPFECHAQSASSVLDHRPYAHPNVRSLPTSRVTGCRHCRGLRMAMAHTRGAQAVLFEQLQDLRQPRPALRGRGVSYKHARAHVSRRSRGRAGFRTAPDPARRGTARASYRSRAIGRADSLVARTRGHPADCRMAATRNAGHIGGIRRKVGYPRRGGRSITNHHDESLPQGADTVPCDAPEPEVRALNPACTPAAPPAPRARRTGRSRAANR